MAGPSVIQQRARASTCGRTITRKHAHSGGGVFKNNPNTQICQQQHALSPHTPHILHRWWEAQQMASNNDNSRKSFYIYDTSLLHSKQGAFVKGSISYIHHKAVMFTISWKTPIWHVEMKVIQPQGGATHQRFLQHSDNTNFPVMAQAFFSPLTLNSWWRTSESVSQTKIWHDLELTQHSAARTSRSLLGVVVNQPIRACSATWQCGSWLN